jgi:membrane carboxypeptidase/penicillin-binding protein
MKAIAVILAAGLVLAGCAAQALSFAQIQEKADTEAADLDAAIQSTIIAYEALPTTTPAQIAAAEKVRLKAWNDTQDIHKAYALGQVVDTTILAADQLAAQQATGKSVAAPAS